jgi:acyl-CoA thioester hydrolase
MNRIKIQLPELFSFSTKMQIRLSDLNYGKHTGNDTILALLQEARQQFLLKRGYEELNIEGWGLIMADAMVEYKRELNYADQIEVFVVATDFDKLGFDFYYKIELLSETENTIAVKAKTGMILYDYTAKKKTPLTEEIISKLS